MMLNRFCLQNNLTNSKIVRLTFDSVKKLLYFNYFDSYYKCEDLGKDMVKKRVELSKAVEMFTVDNYHLMEKTDRRNKSFISN